MKVELLGPMRLTEDCMPYLPTAPKQCQVLAFLLVNANHVVSTAACVEELWGTKPPRSALATLQTYIMQIRKVLARVPSVGSIDGARQVLSTRGQGYFFAVDSGQVDVCRFMWLMRCGRQALGENDDRRVVRFFRDALSLWQGPMLVDVQTGPILEAEVTRMEQHRLTMLEQCIDAELRLGNHHELVGELTALVQRCPVNENLHAQYMVALYRSGRQTEALAVFWQLRQTLNQDLGVDPSKRLWRLQQAILSSDPALDAPGQNVSRLSLDWPSERPATDSGHVMN